MARLRSLGALSLTFSPPMSRSPLVMSSRPTIMRSSVDFPQPEGPTRIMNSPSAMSRLTSLTAMNPSPYSLTRFRIVIAATRVLLVSLARRSAFDGARGQAGDDPSLEHQHDDDNGDGDDDGGGHHG